ncbi:MAG: sigma-70 family RNA polymerase sigma factor [Candidatus Poribacteria bacterium]|nr:sigma-70 family RNA polymerase sigma factor [Candidatus Poribacteria bacterium]
MSASDNFDFDAAVLSQMENIRRVARRCLRNPDEIDDLVQETVLKAYASRDRLRDTAKFNRWIAGIARNTALDWNRRALYRNEREAPMDQLIELPDFRALRFKALHDALEEAEEREQLHRAMGRLNREDREMLRTRYFDEASYGELQQKYGLSYSAVGFRLHRAKARLRKLLASTAAAFIAVFAGMKRAAWGGILLMAKTTKIVVGAAVAAAGILIGGYLWLNNAGAEPESAISALTLEEQSPRVTPLSAVKTTGGESAFDSPAIQSEAVQVDGEASAAALVSNADHETTMAAPVETEAEEDAVEEADKQAAIAAFKAFQNAMRALDLEKAQSMARGEAYDSLGLFAQLLDQADNLEVHPPENPPVDEFVYADGELRVSVDGGLPTVLRKTDGEWYVESMPAAISSSKTVKDEHGNVLEHIETGNLPLTPESLELISEIAEVSEVASVSK